MPKYQIEFKIGASSSFQYFEADKNMEATACEVANAYIKKREDNRFMQFSPYKPPRTLMVREYDTEKNLPKRGGQRRKLHLTFVEAKTIGGQKIRTQWYEYND